MRLRAVAGRTRGSGPSRRAVETCKPLRPDNINSSTANNTPREVSPPRGAIVRVVIPPGAKEGSKIRVFPPGGINGVPVALRVPERSAWFVSRPNGKSEVRHFKVRFEATIVYPEAAKEEVAREKEHSSVEVQLDAAKDKTRSTDDVKSRESFIYTKVMMQQYVRRAVDQFGIEVACIN